jgi:folate-binding protein YgfZ
MNTAWLNNLEEYGASIANGTVCDFGNSAEERTAALSGDTLCDLSHFALIRASGEDSINFLQGQLSNDVRRISETQHQLSSLNSPKGRMLAILRLFRHDDAIVLRLPQSLLEPTLKRLRMFVLMSKVTLEDAGEEIMRFGLAGPRAEALLSEQLGGVPETIDSAVSSKGITALRVAGPHPRFELYGSIERMQPLWRALADNARPVGTECWTLLDIHAGLPNIYPQTTEAFVPQMVNLQRINGVSFKKGCYTGQEIVARMQYLGNLKRRMYLAHVENDTLPQPGDVLSSPQSASGQGAGKVVSAAVSSKGGIDLLCVIEIAAAESGEIYLGEGTDYKLSLQSPPYGFDGDESSPQAAG